MVGPLQPMLLLHPRDNWRSPRVLHAVGTGYTQSGQGPVEVGPINRLPLHDSGA